MLDNMEHNNIYILGLPEGKESEQGIENVSEEKMTQNFLNLVKEKVTQVQEAQRVLNNLDPKRSTPKYIIIRMARPKAQKRILKATREKQVVTYKRDQLDFHLISQQKHFRPEGNVMKYSK